MLTDDAIHIWTIALDQAPPSIALPADETAWIEAAIDPRMRKRRMTVRTAVRAVIGSYLDRDPAGLHFSRAPGGKPRLSEKELSFNLSHSGEVMLIALAAHREIGIDIDRLDRLDDNWQGIARLSFSPEEQADLTSLPAAERGPEAVRLWVRKEAYTKALGSGFAHGFAAVTVGLAARQTASGIGAGWSLIDLPVAAPMAASLAFAGGEACLSYRDFS